MICVTLKWCKGIKVDAFIWMCWTTAPDFVSAQEAQKENSAMVKELVQCAEKEKTMNAYLCGWCTVVAIFLCAFV